MGSLVGSELVDAIFPAGAAWAAPLRAIVDDFAEDGDAGALLELVQRAVTQPELPTDGDYIRVMSLHKSKGLTADLVVVVGCIEGLIPNLPDGGSSAEQLRVLEEQRRLFYVAITRARRILVLSSVTHLPPAEAYRMGAVAAGRRGAGGRIASRFLDELGPACPATSAGRSVLR